MAKGRQHATEPGGPVERRRTPRDADAPWPTAITQIEPNRIAVRGYAVDELMGRVTFAEAIYLLLIGELPSPSMGRLMEALLVSSIDHGVTPPSTVAARNVATAGAPLRASVAAGVLGFGVYHGGDIERCMRFLDEGLKLVRAGLPLDEAARRIVEPFLEDNEAPPGFGHRYHTKDPRAARLFQMALEFEIEAEHIQLARAVERALERAQDAGHRPLPLNVDGAIAAVCGDLGLQMEIGNALFIMSRVPGLIAHVQEERARQRPMRQIDPKDHVYDGPPQRRLPATRK